MLRFLFPLSFVAVLLFCQASMFCRFASAQPPKEAQEFMEKNRKNMENQQLMNRLMSIANSQSLQKELEIVPSQISDLNAISQTFLQEMTKISLENQDKYLKANELIKAGKAKEGMELMQEFQEKMFELSNKRLKEVEEILLPHQINRIRQISRQEILKYQSGFADEFGIPLALADELELSAAEKKELESAIKEAREEYYEQLEKLKQKTHDKILKSIPADKRERVKEIVGDLFDRETENRENNIRIQTSVEPAKQD